MAANPAADRAIAAIAPHEWAPIGYTDDVELATLGWVHWWNTSRIHGYLNDLSPDQFETAYAAARTDHDTTGNHNKQPAQQTACANVPG